MENESQILLDASGANPIWANFDFWSVVFLGLTFVVLCVYTWYTYKLAREAKNAREADFMPFLYVTGSDYLGLAQQERNVSFDQNPRINLVNIGRGPALDVEMEPFLTKYWVVTTKQKALITPRPGFEQEKHGADKIVIHRHLNRGEGDSNILTLKCRDLVGTQHFFQYEYLPTQAKSTFLRYWKESA